MKIAYNPMTEYPLGGAPSDDIVFDLPGFAIYAKGVKFDGRTHIPFKKESEPGKGGLDGLVPFPNYNEGSTIRYLREDGQWGYPGRLIAVDNTTILDYDNTSALNLLSSEYIKITNEGGNVTIGGDLGLVDSDKDGLMSKEDKVKLNYLKFNTESFNGQLENAFTTVSAKGYILESQRNQCLSIRPGTGIDLEPDTINNEVGIVGVPMTGASDSLDGISGDVPAPAQGQQDNYLKGDGTWGNRIAFANQANNADTVGGISIVIGGPGTDPNTIYFVL